MLVAAVTAFGYASEALATSFYEGLIQKPWALDSLAEILVLTICAAVLARGRSRRLSGLALLCTFGWGAVRLWLDPIFDLFIGVVMRNQEMSLGLRMGYQVALFSLAVVPFATAMVASERAGHFVVPRWRRAFVGAYAALAAVVIVSLEFLALTVF